jgi:hypothetical protein
MKNSLVIKNYPRKIETKFLQVSLTSQIKAWFQFNKKEKVKISLEE